MKKLFLLSVLLCVSVVQSVADDEIQWTEITVTALDNGSCVQNAIGTANLESIENLRISGTINGYDFNILRNKMPNLHNLDMTDVDIVFNAYEYTSGSHSENNIFGSYALSGVNSLYSVYLPKSISHVGDNAFSHCENLQSVFFQKGLESIGRYAFHGCYSLENAIFPPTLKVLDYGCFVGTGLKEIRIPSSVESISMDAFLVNSYGLTDVYVYTVEPMDYNSASSYGVNDFSQATLHVPSTSFNNPKIRR